MLTLILWAIFPFVDYLPLPVSAMWFRLAIAEKLPVAVVISRPEAADTVRRAVDDADVMYTKVTELHLYFKLLDLGFTPQATMQALDLRRSHLKEPAGRFMPPAD